MPQGIYEHCDATRHAPQVSLPASNPCRPLLGQPSTAERRIIGDGGKEVEDKSGLFFAITGLYKYCPTIELIDMGLSYSACIIGAVSQWMRQSPSFPEEWKR